MDGGKAAKIPSSSDKCQEPGLGLGDQEGIPVMAAWAEPLDGGVEGEHGVGRGFAGRINVKAAIDLEALVDQGGQPLGVGPGAGGGDATIVRVESKATDGVDGRFAEDGRSWRLGAGDLWVAVPWQGGWEGKEAEVFLGSGGHAAPAAGRGSAKLGANGSIFLSQQHKHGVGAEVGVEEAGLDEGIEQGLGEAALVDEVGFEAPKLLRIGSGHLQGWLGGSGRWRRRVGKGAFQPIQGLFKR